MSAKLAVAIVAHSNRELLLEALAALTDSGRPAVEHTLHVLDNASEDGTCAAVREHFPAVELIQQDFRDGFGANHNRLLARSAAPYHLLLNDDATVEPGAVDALVAYLDAHPEVAVAAPRSAPRAPPTPGPLIVTASPVTVTPVPPAMPNASVLAGPRTVVPELVAPSALGWSANKVPPAMTVAPV